FEAGTIAELAKILSRDDWQEPESAIVPIQPNGSRPPLFCLHAKGGNVLFYRDLAKHLGEDQPFYGIQARRLGGRQVGHATVEKMAKHYIREIKSLQPDGPYFLGGASFGGLAAFEIAQQLHRNGEKVALLALFDTGTPDYPKLLPSTTAIRMQVYSLVRRMQLHKETLRELSNRGRFDYFLDKLAKVIQEYRRKVVNTYKKAVRNYYLRKKGNGSIPTNYIQLEDQISKAGQKYLPDRFPGKLTLFRASNQPLGIEPDPTLGWGPFVSGELEIHEVPGHHGSIIAEPYVKSLAEKLSYCVEKSIVETGTAPNGHNAF
ncbi:MAG: thioesterase domain-containing protein, partial [Pyrinomonadaceae bacterium]